MCLEDICLVGFMHDDASIQPINQPTNLPFMHACFLHPSMYHHYPTLSPSLLLVIQRNIFNVIIFSFVPHLTGLGHHCHYHLPAPLFPALSLEIGYLKCALTILNALNGSTNRECNQRRKILYLSVVVTVGDG